MPPRRGAADSNRSRRRSRRPSRAGLAPWAWAAPALAAAGSAFLLPIANPDLWWHLSAGRWMAENLSWPRADWLSSTLAGKPWADFEWLTQLLWQGLWAAGGMPALWAFKVLGLAAAAAALWAALGLYRIGPGGRALGVLAWALGSLSANDLRPEAFSVFFFLALWSLLEARRLSRPLPGGPRARLAFIAALFALWANLHAGLVYGLALLAIFAAEDLWSRGSVELWLWFGAAFAAAAFNPYGFELYGVILEHGRWLDAAREHIREWGAMPADAWLLPLWVLGGAAALGASLRAWRRRDLPAQHGAALALFGFAAFSHVRAAVYFVSVAVPALAACAPAFPQRWRRALFASSLAAGLAFWGWRVAPELARGSLWLEERFPEGAARFLESEREALGGRKLFNPWTWGGYLGWRLHPDYQVFQDGRYIFLRLLEPAAEARASPEAFQAFLDRHGVELAVLERTRQAVGMPARLRAARELSLSRAAYLFFLPKKDWALVYWDEQALVFAWREAAPARWLARREYRVFRPDDLEAAYWMVREGHVPYRVLAGEVERFCSEVGGDPAERARSWLAGVQERLRAR